MGTSNMEGEIEEESGWTSYLQTDVSLFSETSSTYSNCSSSKILNIGIQNENIGDDNYRLATITTYNSENDEHKIVGGDRNIEEGGKLYCNIKGIIREETDEDEESSNYNCVRASSSTLSDASFTSCFNSHIIISKESFIKPFYPKLHQIIHPKLLKSSNHDINQHKRIRHAAANCLEDTATSSPPASSAVLDSASSSSTATLIKVDVNERQEICYEEESTDAVSTRFKALEALIPRLKEVQAGKGKDEEMVKVIERHVRHLELKVELLSSAWQLSQLKHQ